jgi:hypothetical protein
LRDCVISGKDRRDVENPQYIYDKLEAHMASEHLYSFPELGRVARIPMGTELSSLLLKNGRIEGAFPGRSLKERGISY